VPAKAIALRFGVSLFTVRDLIEVYNRQGPEALETPGKGQRQHAYLSVEEEQRVLFPFLEARQAGHIGTVGVIKTALESGKPIVLAVLKGREKQRLIDFLKTIPKRLQDTIKEVCTDLYEGFINAVEEVLPQAKIVADRFHIAKLYRAAVDELRKTELKALKGVLTKEEYARLKGVRWALRKRREHLAPEEHALLDRLFTASPLLQGV
jgi:transposase